MQITIRPAWPAKNKIENDPKLFKDSEGNRDHEWTFCERQEADIALFLQETGIREIIHSFEENWSTKARNNAKQGDHKQRTLKHRNKQSASKCTSHK